MTAQFRQRGSVIVGFVGVNKCVEDQNMNIPVNKEIGAFFHCTQCLQEGKQDHLEVGFTKIGLQVWCKTHERNLIHIDFQGQRHPANMLARDEEIFSSGKLS